MWCNVLRSLENTTFAASGFLEGPGCARDPDHLILQMGACFVCVLFVFCVWCVRVRVVFLGFLVQFRLGLSMCTRFLTDQRG